MTASDNLKKFDFAEWGIVHQMPIPPVGAFRETPRRGFYIRAAMSQKSEPEGIPSSSLFVD
jgi:hypothetical protein